MDTARYVMNTQNPHFPKKEMRVFTCCALYFPCVTQNYVQDRKRVIYSSNEITVSFGSFSF